jgi:hypothetical protein
MSQKKGRQASAKAPRTRIEDLPRSVDELSEEEASLAFGGIIGIDGGAGTTAGPGGCIGPDCATRVANTSTGSRTLLGVSMPDTDYTNDVS